MIQISQIATSENRSHGNNKTGRQLHSILFKTIQLALTLKFFDTESTSPLGEGSL